MKLNAQYSLRIAEPTTTGPVSRARKQFNTLIKKREAMPAIMRQAEQEFAPLAQAHAFGLSALIPIARIPRRYLTKGPSLLFG